MIELTRDLDNVPTRFAGARLVDLSRRLLQAKRAVARGEEEKIEFDSGYWGYAKEQLLAETHNKCSYCESHLAVVDYGDVEHFRPKSKYWWLAYCLNNYLASCAICNQRFKSNKFPKASRKLPPPRIRRNTSDAYIERKALEIVPDPTDGPGVTDYRTAHFGESPYLVDPYLEDPADVFAWKADLVTEEVEVIPVDDSELATRRVEEAKDVFGLNREQLLRLRFVTFVDYYVTKATLADAGISPYVRRLNQRAFDRMMTAEYPYSGMIKFFEDVGDEEDWIAAGFLVV